MIEALFFLGRHGRLPVMQIRVFIVTPHMLLACLGTIQASVPTVDAESPAHHATRVRPYR